jgi:hypothetical protein
VKRLSRSLGLNVLDEESAVDVHRVEGTGSPIDRDGLGARVGTRVSKLERLDDHLGLICNIKQMHVHACMCMCMCAFA